jgi:hypothetical protein
MDKLMVVLPIILGNLPLILAWLTGIILAIVFWHRHPKVSLLAIIALSGFLVLSITGTSLSILLPNSLREQGLSTAKIMVRQGIIATIITLLSAGFWGLLLAAIFSDRKNNPPRY